MMVLASVDQSESPQVGYSVDKWDYKWVETMVDLSVAMLVVGSAVMWVP